MRSPGNAIVASPRNSLPLTRLGPKFREASCCVACVCIRSRQLVRFWQRLVATSMIAALDAHASDWCDRLWTPWIPPDSAAGLLRSYLPAAPGLYRVRANQMDGLVYVGQTGRDLLERARALASGVFRAADNPPWNDPHTAAPCCGHIAYKMTFNSKYRAAKPI